MMRSCSPASGLIPLARLAKVEARCARHARIGRREVLLEGVDLAGIVHPDVAGAVAAVAAGAVGFARHCLVYLSFAANRSRPAQCGTLCADSIDLFSGHVPLLVARYLHVFHFCALLLLLVRELDVTTRRARMK
jgi:hypothetical protein